MNAQAKSQQIAERIDPEHAAGMEIAAIGGGSSLVVKDMSQVMEFAKMMSVAGIAVREHLRNSPGACLAVSMQALRWGMDPFAVGNKSYSVNDQLAYESQLIAAVVNTRAPLESRPTVTYEGKDNTRRCIVTGYIKGETEPRVYQSPPLGGIQVKNSPLWKSDPDQQLYYFAIRAWARRHVPEVLLGVYAEDEVSELRQEQAERAQIAPPRPETVEDLEETDSGPIFALIDAWGEVIGEHGPGEFIDEFVRRLPIEASDRRAFFEHNSETLKRISDEALVDSLDYNEFVAAHVPDSFEDFAAYTTTEGSEAKPEPAETVTDADLYDDQPDLGGIPAALDRRDAGSSNGRTPDFDSGDAGSSPAPATDPAEESTDDGWRGWAKDFARAVHDAPDQKALDDLVADASDNLNALATFSEAAHKDLMDRIRKKEAALAA